MNDSKFQQVLWDDFIEENEFPNCKPLLAHYTSIKNFDRIVEGEEVWFSNPLNMNDLEELRFGMNQGAAEFRNNNELREACSNQETHSKLLYYFDHHFNHFDDNHVLDTYVMCFSEHDANDYDGALSMWRGYGSNGEGVAFVIDTEKIVENGESPLILSKVHYLTKEERENWIAQKIKNLAQALNGAEQSDDSLNSLAWFWLERLKVFSLFTKHRGFSDEKEWRFVYLNDRDVQKSYQSMFGYNISDKGMEPKLKLKIDKIPDAKSPLSLEILVDRIILGPSISSELSIRSVIRMLELKKKIELAKKVHTSSIPFRA